MAVVGDLRVLLRVRDFRRLLAVRLLSQAADGVFQVALATYVVFSPEKQTSAAAIASAMAVLLLPYSLIGPLAGVLLDRWRRRQVFLYGNLLRAVLAALTAALMVTGVPDWLFYVAALCVTAVNRFVLAGLSAALPRVVARDELVIANALSPTAGTLAATAAAASPSWSGSWSRTPTRRSCCSAGSSTSPRPAPPSPWPCPCWAPTRASSSTCAARSRGRPADWPPGYATCANPAAAGPRGRWRPWRPSGSATGRSPSCSSCSAGTPGPPTRTAGSRCSGSRWPSPAPGSSSPRSSPLGRPSAGGGRWIVACAAGAAVLELALGLTFAPVPLLAGAFVLGVATQGAKIATDTIVQASVADDFRGRIFSVYDVLFNVAFVAAAGVSALLLPADGKSAGLVVLVALIYGAVAVLMTRFDRQ
ncbi:MFS transporter [Actinomadura keratinilytica]